MVARALRSALLLVAAGCATAGGAPPPAAPRAEPQWEEWSDAAFERARRERRILLVSVQASWCHWCHVMNEETFGDPEVIALLQESFVVVRVDSDARPDLAERYARWAWPATAFLTPDAEPITALRGYRDRERFAAMLRRLAADLRAGRPLAAPPDVPTPDPALADLAVLRDRVRAQLDGLYDERAAGWGRPQKYPYAAPVEHAFFAARLGDERAGQRALASLAGYAMLIDPVWGGMYQYSVPDVWTEPHYEKILAVQAGALAAFSEAYRATGDAVWLERARSIYRYLVAQMRDPAGGFYTSQDADLRAAEATVPGAQFYALSDAGRRALGVPRIDRSVYASLNGMTIAALASFHQATLDPEPLAHAVAAADRIERTHLRDGGYRHGEDEEGGLFHLADQVQMAWGLLALHQATGEPRFLERAERTAAFMERALGDPAGGFFAHSPDPAARGVFAVRRKPIADNGVAARVLLRLERLGGDAARGEAARATLRAVADRESIAAEGRKVGEYLLALEEVNARYVLLSVVGPADRAETESLRRAAVQLYEPLRLIEVGRPGSSRYPYPGEPAVYLCNREACSIPVTDPAQISAATRRFLGETSPLPSP